MGWMLMPLRRYADFSGRSRRMEYWMWQIFKLLVFSLFLILFMVLFGAAFASLGATKDPSQIIAVGGGAVLLWLLWMIFALAILIPDIAVGVRRLHDTNRSGWWIIAPLVPYFGGVIVGAALAGSGAGMGPDDGTGNGLLVAGGLVGLVGALLMLVMVVVLLIFMFMDGTPGPNRFGPDPKGRDASAVFA